MAEHAISATAAEMNISVHAYQTTLTIPDRPTLPDFLFHFTRLTQSMMIWIGTVSSDHSAGHSAVDTCLAKDWSCAVPPSTSFPAISTRLNSSNPTDGFSQALAQKIAQKFRIQAFVSIDLPASLLGSDSQIKFALEKQLFGHIQSLLSTKTSQEPKEKTC
ncbi:uncharacterized protein PGTG_13860 [Puccinia graminis f. sp. tritici CRL 75-36-700-3]|uniref:Proteasome assembly chaperone 4 n=1 Tax=Puccinia graminis f. sp. tritici (strain CRL 75-36-700-3 / race SCCL) TaxID=418459 RepID=E3KT64_PUCGT|nr:uncharacterized protein PGTG_13860 [Puccinia graminis f. sp. tritici CRL 75-36-700-3]EFP87489.1 hypothetical protein PGTG_13860 [Puccinia graminis f. sp. tritici CRL 75-36-700-3]